MRLGAGGADHDLLASLGADLRFVLITSQAKLEPIAGEALEIEVVPSAHAKCERCWHYRADVGADRAHPTLCARCAATLAGRDEERRHA